MHIVSAWERLLKHPHGKTVDAACSTLKSKASWANISASRCKNRFCGQPSAFITR